VNGLERELAGLQVAWPATPDLAAAIEPALATRQQALPPRRWLRVAAVAVAVAAAAIGALLALSPGARSAFLEIFHVQGVTVVRVESLPPTRVQAPLALGTRITRAEAERRVGFVLAQPRRLRNPDAVYVGRNGLVTFVYGRPGHPRLLFSQLRGSVDTGVLKKLVAADSIVEPAIVNGHDALFLSGRPHEVMFTGPNGEVVSPVYLAGTVLLWERGGVTFRLEGNLSRARAVELARSVG